MRMQSTSGHVFEAVQALFFLKSFESTTPSRSDLSLRSPTPGSKYRSAGMSTGSRLGRQTVVVGLLPAVARLDLAGAPSRAAQKTGRLLPSVGRVCAAAAASAPTGAPAAAGVAAGAPPVPSSEANGGGEHAAVVALLPTRAPVWLNQPHDGKLGQPHGRSAEGPVEARAETPRQGGATIRFGRTGPLPVLEPHLSSWEGVRGLSRHPILSSS